MTRSAGTRGLMRAGSPPRAAIASRIAARSTTAGTPVKSWRMTRAGRKGTSASPAPPGRHAARVRTSSSVTTSPPACRSTFSSRILTVIGARSRSARPARSRRWMVRSRSPTRSVARAENGSGWEWVCIGRASTVLATIGEAGSAPDGCARLGSSISIDAADDTPGPGRRDVPSCRLMAMRAGWTIRSGRRPTHDRRRAPDGHRRRRPGGHGARRRHATGPAGRWWPSRAATPSVARDVPASCVPGRPVADDPAALADASTWCC